MIAMPAAAALSGGRHQALLQYALKRREHRRLYWDSLWDELCDHFHPDREGFQSDPTEGEDRREKIYGSVPELAARSLTSHVATALRPPGRTWFKAKAKDERLNNIPEVRAYCEQVTRITYGHLYDPRAQFEQQCAHADRDIIVIGTAALQIGWDNAKRHLTIRTHHMKNVVLSTNAAGVHDMAFVFWPLTIRQVCEMFPPDKWPESVKNKVSSGGEPNLEEEHEVLHACLPNADYQKFGGKIGRFPFSSMWISVPDRAVISEGGYYDFPYVTPRWDTATGEVYGRSPAMVVRRERRGGADAAFAGAGEHAAWWH
jgi:head-to-tail connecting protein